MPVHNIPPVFDETSEILILGSFPSVKSREQEFFYAHPQNRFWRVISAVFGESLPVTVPEKKQLLLSRHVALWDVAHSCTIEGSSDLTLKNAEPNDLSPLLQATRVKKIFTNGCKAHELYTRLILPQIGIPDECLPSTSPANARFSLAGLTDAWRVIRKSPVRPGRYRHFKGNEYEVLYTARHSETLEEMVVYRALYGDGDLWVRPASMWNEEIERDGKKFRRFTYIDK